MVLKEFEDLEAIKEEEEMMVELEGLGREVLNLRCFQNKFQNVLSSHG